MKDLNLRLLITGPSGCGKTTISKEMTKLRPQWISLDLDQLGAHQATEGGTEAWVVDGRLFITLAKAPISYMCAGICRNMFEQQTVMFVDWRKTLDTGKHYTYSNIPREPIRVKPIAYAYDWTHRFLIVYEPNEDQMSLRFGKGRDNPWGKDPVTRKKTIEYAQKIFDSPAPRGFVKIDTTGLDIKGVCDKILAIVEGETSEASQNPDEGGIERSATSLPNRSLEANPAMSGTVVGSSGKGRTPNVQ